MLLKKRTVGRLFTLQTSFNPIPYVCCWQFLRRSNFENTVFARWPWQPSPNNVSFAWNSIPRSKFAYSIFNVEIYNFWGAFHLHGQAGQIVIFGSTFPIRGARNEYFKFQPEPEPTGNEQEFQPEPEPSYGTGIRSSTISPYMMPVPDSLIIMERLTKRDIGDEKRY